MTQTLEQLSAELLPCPFCNDPMRLYGYDLIAHVNQGNCIIGQQAWEASDKNIAAWNQRAGHLVAVADDAMVERVARAIGTSLAYDIGMDVRAGSLTDDEKRKVAAKAIAAMKDTQPTKTAGGYHE